MSRIECEKCADVIDVIADSIELPFICRGCQEPEKRFIVQFKSCGGWMRSANKGTRGTFGTIEDAKLAITAEPDIDKFEYRVVPMGTPDAPDECCCEGTKCSFFDETAKDPDDGDPGVEGGVEDTSDVEAANEMIEDLQSQLDAEKKTTAVLRSLIAYLLNDRPVRTF